MKKGSRREKRMDQEEREKRRVKIGPESRREGPGCEPDSMPRLAAGREKGEKRNQSQRKEMGEEGNPRDEPDSMPRLVQRGGQEESTGRRRGSEPSSMPQAGLRRRGREKKREEGGKGEGKKGEGKSRAGEMQIWREVREKGERKSKLTRREEE